MCVYNNGCIYFGDWKNDIKYGYSIQYYNNNAIYRGEWYKNMSNGYGKLLCINITYDGIWDNDIFIL